MKTSVRASITVEVEISGPSRWSDDTKVSQVRQQALNDFDLIMRQLGQPSVVDGVNRAPHPIRVIGAPTVHYIIAGEDAPK